jgi:hypothetical protein
MCSNCYQRALCVEIPRSGTLFCVRAVNTINFREPDYRVDSLAGFYLLCLFLGPRQHQSEGDLAARHLTNVSVLAISFPPN